MKTCRVIEVGRIPYGEAFELQRRLVAARKADQCPDLLLLCEHPHVITLGRNGKREHLRVSPERLGRMGVEFHPTDRGGDITYHGPGQIVGYPIVHLAEIRRDVGWYVRQLERTMIEASVEFGVAACRVAGRAGVWVRGAEGEESSPGEKLGAIGVHLSRWVTSHGFAYNASTDLRYFDLIVPCGIADSRATSLEKLLGREIDRREVRTRLVGAFGRALGLQMIPAGREEIAEWVSGARADEGAEREMAATAKTAAREMAAPEIAATAANEI